ncbi:hypothetical protein A2U01_0059946, partial [Trifolium medium]|nr:hypothetical protein [Trifolium medium]
EEYCWVRQRRESAHTDAEYTEMLQTLALPGRDWHYTSRGWTGDYHTSIPH